jgi:hypothetical protein
MKGFQPWPGKVNQRLLSLQQKNQQNIVVAYRIIIVNYSRIRIESIFAAT